MAPIAPHRLQTTLTPAQEAIVVYLRQQWRLPLDDLLVVTREFLNPAVSRSGLDRCLRRHGVAHLKALQAPPAKTPSKPFKAYEPGFVHLDVTRRATKLTRRTTKLNYLPALAGEPRRFLFVAIDCATRWVFVALKRDRTARSAKAFLKALLKAAPFRIQKCLTDNGSEFTDRFLNRQRKASGQHLFDQTCAVHGIEHRLTPPRHPQTNGMVERFNGRIDEILQTHHFDSNEALETTLLRYADLYNHHIPQRALVISLLFKPSKTGKLPIPISFKNGFTTWRDLTPIISDMLGYWPQPPSASSINLPLPLRPVTSMHLLHRLVPTEVFPFDERSGDAVTHL